MKAIDQIRAALENDEFFLVYLPTMVLQTGQCVGAEALIRWRHNDEIISPLEFIPAIENTPLSGLITYWVIEQIGRDLGGWLRENNDVHVGVNVPPDIIGRGGLEYAVSKAGLMDVVGKLILEVTERGLPDQQGLNTLREMKGDTRIALDDFGTGDANLVELSQIPADILKIDKFFVDQIVSKTEIPRIIKGLTAFALAMDFELIAEGIETVEQVTVLRTLKVEMGQGWYFSKPLLQKEFIEFYKKNSHVAELEM